MSQAGAMLLLTATTSNPEQPRAWFVWDLPLDDLFEESHHRFLNRVLCEVAIVKLTEAEPQQGGGVTAHEYRKGGSVALGRRKQQLSVVGAHNLRLTCGRFARSIKNL